MNKLIFISILAWLPATGAFAQSASNIPTQQAVSRISAVTLYPSQARVTREAEVQIPAGESLVEFTGLPISLDRDSIQVSGRTPAGVSVVNFEIREVYGTEAVSEEAQKLRELLYAVRRQEKELTDGLEVLAEREGFLADVRRQIAGPPSGPIPYAADAEKPDPAAALETIKAGYALYGEELTAIRASRRQINAEMEQVRPRITQVDSELKRLQQQTEHNTCKVVLALRAENAATGNLLVHYVIGGASWEPLYIARADTIAKRVTLISQAKITQTTSEDWSEVALTLSTSRPNRGGTMPAISPNFVNITTGTRIVNDARIYESAGAQYALAPPAPMSPGESNDEEVVLGEIAIESAQVQQVGASVIYNIATPVTVPSDGEAHQVNVLQLDLEPKFLLETTPRLQADVFLKAKLKNESGGPLLPGQVTIFRDGDMVGRSGLEFIATDEEYDLFLGIDDTMKAEFQELTDKRSESGLINKSAVLERQFQLKLKNFAKESRKVTVLDQIPVSKNEKVEVTDKIFEPKPKGVEGDTGKITWEVEIPADGEQKLTNYYKVSWPKDSHVTGL